MPNEPHSPLALDAYEALADEYAERVATKPFNASLERPATTRLLPDINGWTVLDTGCGPGVTTVDLEERGAHVVGMDVSPRMLRHARERTDDTEFVRADFGRSFPFSDGVFDLVHSSLAFDYVRDWRTLFEELARALRSEGILVCSVGHPFADALYFEPENYFETERVSDTWTSFGDPVEVPTYRRPLAAVLNPLLNAGFTIERIVEAQPTERFREKNPEMYERVSREPTFLALRARTMG